VGRVLAVDVGATKMSVGIVTNDGKVVERRDAPSTGAPDADALFGRLAALVDGLPTADVHTCGVGCAGPISLSRQWGSPLNLGVWHRFPLGARLAAHTGLPTYLDNDAKALALGEGWRGAAAGERHYLAMVVSTGIGGGIVLDGRLLDGSDGNAGHVGHVVVEPDGRPCPCGGRGCVEAEASGQAIAAITGRPAREAPAAVVERTGTLVGRAVASAATLLALRLAVVSGSVALGYGKPFFAAAQREIDLRCGLAFAKGTRIVPGGLGDDGPLVGAARVALVRSG
jgi:glucokinase